MESPSTVEDELTASNCTPQVGDDSHGSAQSCADSSRWICKAFLDILRQHIIPNLGRFYHFCEAAVDVDSKATANYASPDGHEHQPEGRVACEAWAAIALVCSDWSAAQLQAELGMVEVRLWDSAQVRSLASYLRRRPHIAALRLKSPLSDMTDTPGMVAAVGDLLYGNDGCNDSTSDGSGGLRPGRAVRCDAGDAVQSGGGDVDVDGRSGEGGGGGGDGTLRRRSALPRSLRALEADGPTAVPLLLLAAAELPLLESVTLRQLPATWFYVDGALPWPAAAAERLAQLVPREVYDSVTDKALYGAMYGAAMKRRFRPYWVSYDGALAALLYHRGRHLRHLSLEAPSRCLGLKTVEFLLSQGGAPFLEYLCLEGFGLRQEPHTAPRVPLHKAGLRLTALNRSANGGEGVRGGAALAVGAAAAAAATAATAAEEIAEAAQAGGGGGVPCAPYGGCGCCLAHLELVSCGVEPLQADVFKGLTGLTSLSLRYSCFTWRDRPPDLRQLTVLRSLDLRRTNWLTVGGSPWDEQLLLPTSLESLDIVGFSSLASVDLRPLERLTSLAELADITLQPDPAEGPRLQPPYTGLAALTCMDTVFMYVGRATSECRWDSEGGDEDANEDADGDDGDGSSSSSSSDGVVRHGGSAPRHRNRNHGCRHVHSRRTWLRGVAGGGDAIDTSNGGNSGSIHTPGSRGGSGSSSSSSGGSDIVQPPALLRSILAAPQEPPLVSLTLYGVVPHSINHLFPALSLLTRLMFCGGCDEEHGDGEDDDTSDNNGVAHFVLQAGELPRLRELVLCQGLVGYGRLVLVAATSLTRLEVDNVEYLDVRYLELPPSLEYLSLIDMVGLPELYHLSVDNMLVAIAQAGYMVEKLLMRGAAAAGGGGGSDGNGDGGSSSGGSSGSSSGSSADEDLGGGQCQGCSDGLAAAVDNTQDLKLVLKTEVERQFVQRLLPPLRQLQVLQLNWDIVTHGPLSAADGGSRQAAAPDPAAPAACEPASGRGGGGTSGGATASVRWPFPYLPALEELDVACLVNLPDEDLDRVLLSCPSLRGVTHRHGECRVSRDLTGTTWVRRCTAAEGDGRAADGGEG